MKQRLLAALFATLAATAQAQLDDEFGDAYSDELLPGLQSNVVRAQLVPLRKAAFSAGISAIVSSVTVQEGESVDEGALMLTFDCDSLHATRDIAAAKIKSAQATLKVNEELLRLNSVGPLEIELNRAELRMAEGERDSVQAKLKHCEIRAPFAGAVTQRAVDPHQFVAEGEPLLELVSAAQLEVSMLMPSTSLSWLRVGTEFSMLVEELNSPMPGKIVRIGGAVDPVSLTVSVFGKLDDYDERLLPGMSGRVQFINQEFE